MDSRNRTGRPATPRDGQRADKAREGLYRSLEGVLGQAVRASRRAGGRSFTIWRLVDAGGWRFQESNAPAIAGAVLFAEVKARWLEA